MRYAKVVLCIMCFSILLAGCGRKTGQNGSDKENDVTKSEAGIMQNSETKNSAKESVRYTIDTKVEDVIEDPVFGNYGRLLFPVEQTIDCIYIKFSTTM